MNAFESHSQAAQDLFAWEICNRETHGKFLDIGCGFPVEINNTLGLEKLGWIGLSVDVNSICVNEFRKQRITPVICYDAATVNIPNEYRSVDYLSLDVDEAQVSALKNLLRNGVHFRVATIEHASYLYGPNARNEIRRLLTHAGYFMLCEDVCNGGVVYEDWWIDPTRVHLPSASRMVSVGVDGPEIAKRATNRFNGFNGQLYRQQIFVQLLAEIQPTLLVETGTCDGETAGYMAEISGLPVLTCEIEPHWQNIAIDRMKGFNVTISCEDSRTFLKRQLAQCAFNAVLFYLDAHWGQELPLADELAIIASSSVGFVAIIDDFKIPDDPGYGFDDYGNDKVIGIPLIAPILEKHSLAIFFPNVRSELETRAKRGTAIVCRKGAFSKVLGGMPSLRTISNL